MMLHVLLIAVATMIPCMDTTTIKPHIVIIMSDDMGFNDVGSHGSNQIPTPNIDALATFGINLNRYYVAPMCTPSRAALMTGKYPSTIGMQHFVIPSEQPWGLGLDQKLLPEYMKNGGYSTHIIGKWHLGFYRQRYTPCRRGFDSHFGYLGPYIDYFNHSLTRIGLPWKFESGYDMRKNFDIHYESKGQYATNLFADVAVETIQKHNKEQPMFMYLSHLAPHAANYFDQLQAPAEDIANFMYIKDEKRRKYAAMLHRLDVSVGRVVGALKERQMLENSVILFFCDNGAPIIAEHGNGGSNYPFKGQKDSPWEGAIRSAGAIWSPLLQRKQRVSHQLIHITDWLPTFAHLAGVSVDEPIDGQDVWSALSLDLESPRHEVLAHLDDAIGYSAYIQGRWKYVNGSTYGGKFDKWLSEIDASEMHPSYENYGQLVLQSEVGIALLPYSHSLQMGPQQTMSESDIEHLRATAQVSCGIESHESYKECNPLRAPCLFDIVSDPCERKNLAAHESERMEIMQAAVEKFRLSATLPRNRPSDRRSNPINFNNTWTWWYDELELNDDDDKQTKSMAKPKSVSIIAFVIIASLTVLYSLYNT